jgi:hypothetical protein
MAAVPPEQMRRRPRRGSVERPVNARLYRGTWLLVGIPLLIAAFSLWRPATLPPPATPPSFDGVTATQLARELTSLYPDRVPGTPDAERAAQWFSDQLAPYGYRTVAVKFQSELPGYGRRTLENVLAVAPGRSSSAILVVAHRDDTGTGPGADDNASGTAALIELARIYAAPAGGTARSRGTPAHTILFLSTDGGAYGGVGIQHFVEHSAYRRSIAAAVDLDAIAGSGAPVTEIGGDRPRSPAGVLVESAVARILEQTGEAPRRHHSIVQLLDLAFPFTLHEQGPLIAHGIPALTITTQGHPAPSDDVAGRLDSQRMTELGRAAEQLVGSLDNGLELVTGTSPAVFLGGRELPGWAIEMVLVAALFPYFVTIVDLFARCRRRRISLLPALRGQLARIVFWLFVGGAFGLLALLGAWPRGAGRPLAPGSPATSWPILGLAALGLICLLGWIVERHRLVPRRPVLEEETLAGHAVALLALAILSLLVAATNPFALALVLPALHAWLWLPQIQGRPRPARLGVLLAGTAGPVLVLALIAARYHLGADVVWYLAEHVALGYIPAVAFVLFLAWLAILAQLTVLTFDRYAPYPGPGERPAFGPIRQSVRFLALNRRARRAARGAAGGNEAPARARR